jgi:hypothetical protein
MLVGRQDSLFSVRHQCALLGLNRSSLSYESEGENEENLLWLLNEQYTRTQCKCVLKIVAYLRNSGYAANPKRVAVTAPNGAGIGVSEAQYQ